ncbi:MAG: hypothetical protein ABJ327_23395 [Litoreibacter sp.]
MGNNQLLENIMSLNTLTPFFFAASISALASPTFGGAMYNLPPRVDFFDDVEAVSKGTTPKIIPCDAGQDPDLPGAQTCTYAPSQKQSRKVGQEK